MEKRDSKGRFTKGSVPYNKGQKLSQEQIKKLSNAKLGKKGEQSNAWKGGRYPHTDSYIYVYKPEHPYANSRGYVFEHRLVMEEILGRYLVPNVDDVHHINGKKWDNRKENLQHLIHGSHTTLTNTKDMTDRQCSLCNRLHDELVTKYKGHRWYGNEKTKWICSNCMRNKVYKKKRL